MEARGIRKDVSPYNAVITALERAGEWRRALTLLDTMAQRAANGTGAPPDIASFTSCMQALCTAGEVDEGFKLLARVHKSEALTRGSYQMHQMLQQQCRAANDTDGANAVHAPLHAPVRTRLPAPCTRLRARAHPHAPCACARAGACGDGQV
jgi:pentatricopeptide repeat protein